MRPLTQNQVERMQLRYYNSDVHRAAFVLPEFARKVSPWVAGPEMAQGLLGSPPRPPCDPASS